MTHAINWRSLREWRGVLKNPVSEGDILYDSIVITFFTWQNYRQEKSLVVARGWAWGVGLLQGVWEAVIIKGQQERSLLFGVSRVWVAVSTCTGDKLQRTKRTHRRAHKARRVIWMLVSCLWHSSAEVLFDVEGTWVRARGTFHCEFLPLHLGTYNHLKTENTFQKYVG